MRCCCGVLRARRNARLTFIREASPRRFPAREWARPLSPSAAAPALRPVHEFRSFACAAGSANLQGFDKGVLHFGRLERIFSDRQRFYLLPRALKVLVEVFILQTFLRGRS